MITWERYCQNQEQSMYDACLYHRTISGLITPKSMDLENIDYEYECHGYKTCPMCA